jgi:hypothetical protein
VPYRDPEQARERHRRYYLAHREAELAKAATRYASDPGRHLARAQRWQARNEGYQSAYNKRWRERHPDYKRDRYNTDENVRIRALLCCNLHRAIKRHESGRDWRADAKLGAILGCSKPDLIAHIEAQFLPGMSWANYGRKGWEIDHIKPCASFDLTQHDQVLLCFHYTNLRPLWRLDNLRRPRKE